MRRPPNDAELEKTIDYYVAIMKDIMHRSTLLGEILGRKFEIHPATNLEFAQLQVRMISEAVAVCCLLAHRDLHHVDKKAYKADDIVAKLQRINKSFYPQPCNVDFYVAENAEKYKGIVKSLGNATPRPTRNVLSKEQFLKSYKEAHNYLHFLSLKKLTSGWHYDKSLYESTAHWNETLRNLLFPAHQIYFADTDQIFVYKVNADGGVATGLGSRPSS